MTKKQEKLTGSQALLESLLREGVDTIFGYPGGAIMSVYDALYDYKDKLRHILVRHEQAAAHAAEGYAHMTGKPGVALVTSGPGATNLVTGIADAMLDSVPLVCISGQVALSVLGTDAFQEVDVVGVTTPITKWNYQVTRASEIPDVIAKAFYIAKTGRPGPVLIDITKNAQMELAEYTPSQFKGILGYKPTIKPNIKQIKLAATLLNKARKPYMLVGHGVLISNAQEAAQKLAQKLDMPVASTLLGLSAFPVDYPLYVGMLGMHGNYGPNVLTQEADVILAVGMRFDDRVTGKLSDYARGAKVIHIDVDPAELNKNVKAEIPIVADAKIALEELIKFVSKGSHTSWVKKFKEYEKVEEEKIFKKEAKPEKDGSLTMAQVVNTLSKMTKGEAVIVSDVGQHQMVAARNYKHKNPHSYITSGGLGTMGFALPASMGVKVAVPKKQVIAIIGDGSFQMNIQELATIAQEQLPVKVVILNNNFLGMVRQWQELFFDSRYSFVNLKNPDFVAVAKGFYLDAAKVEKAKDLPKAFEKMLASEKPYILEVVVKKETNVFPMVPTGAAVHEIRLE